MSEKKTLLLTGASRGIGHATVKHFNASGWQVFTASRKNWVAECPWAEGLLNHIHLDLEDIDSVVANMAAIKEKLGGRLDALVNNAKSIMTLLDHYPEKFGTEHTLNLESFSKVIDYGQVFSRNTIGNFMDTIIYQIERNAPKREVVEGAQVDVHV